MRYETSGEQEMTMVFHAGVRHERRDAAAHRQRILEVARDLFARHGVAAVTMHQIAQAASIGQGTLYRRYANKGDLCCDLVREHHEQFVASVESRLAAQSDMPALERLDGLIRWMLQFISESMALLETVVTTQMRKMDCDGPPSFSRNSSQRLPWFQGLHDLLEDLLTEAIARQEIAPLDVAYTADLLLVVMNPIALRYQQTERGYSLERIADGVRHIFITGIHPTTACEE